MSKCFTLESDSTVDPLIEVACFSELKYSSSKEKIPTGGVQATLWNEHIFFDFRNKVRYQAAQLKFLSALQRDGEWNYIDPREEQRPTPRRNYWRLRHRHHKDILLGQSHRGALVAWID